jgi:hypothetical protein
MRVLGLGLGALRRLFARKTESTSDPTVSSDVTLGYRPGDVWTNTATGNVFNNVVSTAGVAVWRHVPRLLAASSTPVSGAADTAENTLATITVPASALGSNGLLLVSASWVVTNSANNKVLRARYSTISGTIVANFTATTQPTLRMDAAIQNTSASAQNTSGEFWASAGNSILAPLRLPLIRPRRRRSFLQGRRRRLAKR